MVTLFRLKCRIDIEATIDVPPTSFFVVRETAARICYKINGKNRYIHLNSPEKFAAFLKKHGVIDRYDDDGKMYRKSLLTSIGTKGEPVQHTKEFEVKREDILLNRGIIQTMAAERELGRNKIVKMFVNEMFKTAA